jgi:curved DNA-binding protein
MLGGKLTVQLLDKSLSINIPAGTDSDKTFRLKEMGMPEYSNPKQRGDAYVRVVITVPKNLTDKDRELLSHIINNG